MTTILGCLIFIGFSIIGILIKTWFFPNIGLLFGLFMIGLGYFIDGTLKKENGHQVLWRMLKIIIPIIILLNVLMAISKLVS
jgi:hypothetical protein